MMADLDDLDKRIRDLETGFASEKVKVETERVWLSIVGLMILAWLGLTTYYTIPELIKDTAAAKVEEDLRDLQAEANLHIIQIRSARDVAQAGNPIFWVEVENTTFGSVLTQAETERNYCHFDRAIVDAALGGWSEWDAHRILIANPTIGEVSAGMVFRSNGEDPARPAHARFGPTTLTSTNFASFEPDNRRSNWQEAQTCILGFVVPNLEVVPPSDSDPEVETD